MDLVTTTVETTPTPRVTDQKVLVQVDDLKIHFPIRSGIFKTVKGTVKAVDGVSFDVRRGETLGLVGESGCGKSTIGRAMIRLREPTAGTVAFDGVDLGSLSSDALRKMRRRMQIIFQDPYGSLDPRMTVGSTVSEPIETHGLAAGQAKRDRVAELLTLVGLDPAYVNRYPHEFSGGQRQRIGVARALAVEPEFIVCDEPISALDVSIQAQVLNLLTDLRSRLGLTYLFVAHDLSVVKHISDRVAVMYLGKVVEIGPPDQLYAAPGHPYTRALLSAVPVPDPTAERKRKRVILQGDVPSPVNPPPGCRFHTRCWLYERLGQPEECRTVDPPLVAISGEHQAACHFAEESVKSDVGVAHIEERSVRHGTPTKALESLAGDAARGNGNQGDPLQTPGGAMEALAASLGAHLPSPGAPVADLGAPGSSAGVPGPDPEAPNVDPQPPAPGTRPS
ncbi:MAG: ATP-binding cassette domain-containing protein [Chloroflexota bacterium]|jgi:oligopeptide transport system ATP-binding protein|nr:ATP-binding cassette domain-containing protein [Chloroflexota bacterium]